jgi:hypothetical protein
MTSSSGCLDVRLKMTDEEMVRRIAIAPIEAILLGRLGE